MKVELTLEEVCRLHFAAAALGEGGLPEEERKVYVSAARKLRGAAERSGARIEEQGFNSAWKLPRR